MKRIALFSLSIILVLMLTACGSQKCTCLCCTTQTVEANAPQGSESMNEEVETLEDSCENPIVIDSRGHEIIITMSYGKNTESFTLQAGDSQMLSIQELSYLTNRAYIYVIVI